MFKTLVTFSVAAMAFGRLTDSDTCTADHSAQADCDSDSACTWCKSAAVPSQCYSVEDAAALPSSIFACDNAMEEIVTDCGSFGDQSTCDDSSDCTWCKSAAVPSQCYSLEDAASLPSSIFACDASELWDTDCHSISAQSDCDSQGCSWCHSAAVGDSCFTVDEAEAMVPSIFSCDL